MKILLNILIITILSINLSLADELQVFDFTEAELAELQVRKVRGADNKTISWAQKEGSWKVASKKTRKAKAKETWPLWRALDAGAVYAQADGLKEIPMAVTKFTIVDSPEKMRAHAGYSIIIPQIKERAPYSEQTNTKKKPKASIKSEE